MSHTLIRLRGQLLVDDINHLAESTKVAAIKVHDNSRQLGKVFVINDENLRRWKGWWKYIITDQFLIWAPGCFMGMALPALLSIR